MPANLSERTIERDFGNAIIQSETITTKAGAKLSWKSAPGQEVNLTTIVKAMLPQKFELPDEVPEIVFSDMLLSLTPKSGAFELKGTRDIRWTLPFCGLALSIGRTSIHLIRENGTLKGKKLTPGKIRFAITVETSATVELMPGVSLGAGGQIAFLYNPKIVEVSKAQSIDLFSEQPQPSRIISQTTTMPNTTITDLEDTWILNGNLNLSLHEHTYKFGASWQESADQRIISLFAGDPDLIPSSSATGIKPTADMIVKAQAQPSLVLGDGLAELYVPAVQFTITRKDEVPQQSSNDNKSQKDSVEDTEGSETISKETEIENPRKGQKNYQYEWSLTAGAGIKLNFPIPDYPISFAVVGRLTFFEKEKESGFMFIADQSDLALPLPIPETNAQVHLGLDRIGLKEVITETNQKKWVFTSATSVWLTEMPTIIQNVLPDKTTGKFTLDGQNMSVSISRLLAPIELDLPPLVIRDISGEGNDVYFDLAPGALDISNFTFQIHETNGLVFTLDLGFGIPGGMELRAVTGDNPAAELLQTLFNDQLLPMFNTYIPDDPKSIIQIRLGASSKKGFRAKLLNSPFSFVKFETDTLTGATWCDLDMGDSGAVRFLLPEFSYDGIYFTATGAFQVIRQLQLPLKPLKLGLVNANIGTRAMWDELLPDAIPVMEQNLFDDGGLRVDDLVHLMETAGIEVADETKEAFQLIRRLSGKLPESFRQYLNIDIPDSLSFDISLSTDGGARINIQTSEGQPLKFLIPAGPGTFMGIQLHSLMLGEILAGSLFVTDAHVEVDYFDVITLASSLLLPDNVKYVPNTREFKRRLIIEKLFMLIVYQTGIPVPIPLFFEQIGLESYDLTGLRMEAHLGFPKPILDIGAILQTFPEMQLFFTDADYLLKAGDVENLGLFQDTDGFDIKLKLGKNYMQLPEYLGGDELGINFEQDIVFSATRFIAILMNAVKKPSINRLIQSLPLNMRIGQRHVNFFNILEFNSYWLTTTPAEYNQIFTNRENFARTLPGSVPRELLEISDADFNTLVSKGYWSSSDGIRNIFNHVIDHDTAERAKHIIPQNASAKTEGIITFMRGQASFLHTVSFDVLFGLVATGEGVMTAMNAKGQIGDLIEAQLSGSLLIEPKAENPGDVFGLIGHAHMNIMNQPILRGDLHITGESFFIDGEFDLFPDGYPVDVEGRITGNISKQQVLLRGDVEFKILDIVLAGAVAEITHQGVYVRATFLDQSVMLSAQNANGALTLYGTMDEINFANLLRIPSPSIYINTQDGFYAEGAIHLLGSSVHARMYYRNKQFELNTIMKLFNVFTVNVDVWGGKLMTGATDFGVQIVFQSDFKTQIAQIIVDKLKSTRDAINADLTEAQNSVQLAQAEVKKINADIEKRTREVEKAFADAKKALQDAENLLAREQEKVRRIDQDIQRKQQEVQAAFNQASAELRRAQDDLNAKQREVNRLNGIIAARRAEVQKAYDAATKDLSAAQADITNAQREVDKINADIKWNRDKVNWYKKNMTVWNAVAYGSAIAYHETAIGTLTASREIANGVLQAAKDSLSALKKTITAVPPELDPVLSGMIASRDIALAALRTAQDALRVLEGSLDLVPPETHPEILALIAARELAVAGMEAAKLTLKGLQDGLDLTPPELDLVLLGLYGSREIANGALEVAIDALDALKIANSGLFDVLSAITNWNPGELIQVHQALFRGQLSQISGTRITIFLELLIHGQFVRQYNFDFDFSHIIDSTARLVQDFLLLEFPKPGI